MKTHISDPHGWPFTALARIFDRTQPRDGRKKTLFRLPARDLARENFRSLSEFAPVLLIGLGLLAAGRVTAQIFTTGPDGAYPYAGLILSGNTLYGTAYGGGGWGNGTVFALNTDGTGFTNLHSFTATQTNSLGFYTNGDGANPSAGLILSGNTLYGTTVAGGSSGRGTVFALNTDGTGFTNLYSFTAIQTNSLGFYTNGDGATPRAGLILSGSILYGTAEYGGDFSGGTVFALNTDGTGFTNLHSFTPTFTNSSGVYTNSDGANPYAGLILSGNTLYGTAQAGGNWGKGTVFAINTDGTGFTNLHAFTGFQDHNTPDSSDGASPMASLILESNILYGTTKSGGRYAGGTVFAINTAGFKILHSFASNPSDGANPYAGLILSGNTLYGTVYQGGYFGYGTVFAVNTDGTGFNTLYGFSVSRGELPYAGLILSGDTLYGTTSGAGSWGFGTVFAVNTNGGFAKLHDFQPTLLPGPQQLTISLAGTDVLLMWPSVFQVIPPPRRLCHLPFAIRHEPGSIGGLDRRVLPDRCQRAEARRQPHLRHAAIFPANPADRLLP